MSWVQSGKPAIHKGRIIRAGNIHHHGALGTSSRTIAVSYIDDVGESERLAWLEIIEGFCR